MKNTLTALIRCQQFPEMPHEEFDIMKKIFFMEAITESILQLCLSCLVLRAYGISSDATTMASQILNLTTSLVSVVISFGNVSYPIQYPSVGLLER